MAMWKPRRNPIDPLTTGMAAVSLAWNLAVSRELKDIREQLRRKNPGGAMARLNALERKIKSGGRSRRNPTLLIARANSPSPLRRANPGLALPRGVDKNDPDFKAAYAKYKEFHLNGEPMEIVTVDDAPEGLPKFLVALGRAPEVTYSPPKRSPKGQGKPPFMHEWNKHPFLVMSPDEKFLGYLGRGSRYRVGPAGIEG